MTDIDASRPKPTPRPAPGPRPTAPRPVGPRPPSPTPMGGHLPIGAGYPLPRLGEVVRDVERLLAQALQILERQWDPTSGPQQQDVWDPSTVDESLGAARTEVRVALLHVGDVGDLVLPPVGSAVAVRFPTRSE